jgi:biotin carboxyl carrier protein
MYSIKVNNRFDYVTDSKQSDIILNGEEAPVDIAKLSDFNYHFIKDMRSYNVEVVNFNAADKTAEIKVNGNIYQVKAKDQFDALLDQLGLSNLNSNKVSEIKAPMPGLVLKVLVNEDDEIKKGDNLLILEAMKMENIVKAPADVTIKSVKVKAGDKVEKGQLLVQFK